MKCRSCSQLLGAPPITLGGSPIANAFLHSDQMNAAERFYPLNLYFCRECTLLQMPEFESPEQIFGEYAYFSSFSDSWLKHSEEYSELAIRKFGLTGKSLVVEIASNDGYLLQYFKARGIPVLGVEAAANVAREALRRGIQTEIAFFGELFAKRLVKEVNKVDLIVANNVLAHVPELNDFVEGVKVLLAPDGVFTAEFPHLMNLLSEMQFDTIYHEHFSYFSLTSIERVLKAHGLRLFDVQTLPTHGGSLRIFACHEGAKPSVANAETGAVATLKALEAKAGLFEIRTYEEFNTKVQAVKHGIVRFLLDCKEQGRTVAAYGAPAKGNTLLNYCGIRPDLLAYTVDRNPRKQGRFLPGSHIPVFDPEQIRKTRPDFVLILPWNLKDEIVQQLGYIREWGGKFAIPIPKLSILEAL